VTMLDQNVNSYRKLFSCSRMSVIEQCRKLAQAWAQSSKTFYGRILRIFIKSWCLYHKTYFGRDLRFP
jgi:hypothetical protein